MVVAINGEPKGGFSSADSTRLSDVQVVASDIKVENDQIRSDVYDLHNRVVATIQRVYPNLAAGVAVNTSDIAWAYGDFSQIIPPSVVTSGFTVTAVETEADSDGSYQLSLYTDSDATTEISHTLFHRETNTTKVDYLPMVTGDIAENSMIYARLASSTTSSDAALVKVYYTEQIVYT